MKHLLDPYLRLAAVFLGGSLLVSFLFSVLYYFNWKIITNKSKMYIKLKKTIDKENKIW